MVPVLSWLVARIKIEALTRRAEILSRAGCGEGSTLRLLRGSPRSHRQIPQLGQNARHLHSVELRNKRQNLGHKLVFHQFARASRSREDSVGVAFSFSIFDT